MSGGSIEYVMGNYNNSINNSGFSSLPNAKYFDLYTTTNSTTACSGGVCYRQALSETSGWYGDNSKFVAEYYRWFKRGGYRDGTYTAGVFYYDYSDGSTYSDISFHVVLQATND